MEQSLDTILDELVYLVDRGPSKREYLSWLFEYAYQTLAYEKISARHNNDYLILVMKIKAGQLMEYMTEQLWKRPMAQVSLTLIPRCNIPKIVKEEHKQ